MLPYRLFQYSTSGNGQQDTDLHGLAPAPNQHPTYPLYNTAENLVQWHLVGFSRQININPLLGDFSVNKLARIAVLSFVVCFVLSPALVLAQEHAVDAATEAQYAKATAKSSYGYLGIGIGAGLAAIGGGIGIGLLSASVVDASARQPEMQGKLVTTMFIAAALIEGLALFALVICILCLFM